MEYPLVAILIGVVATFSVATLVAALIARTGFPLPSTKHRIGCIDGLRGYLALSVLIHHFVIWMQVTRLSGSWAPPPINILNQLGAGGVALFFMTTGFVFYPRVLAGLRDTAWLAIYTTRVFRIVPLIVVSVAIITLIIRLRTGRAFNDDYVFAAIQWIASWREPPLLDYPDSGRLNAYVLWSLRYEWLFYLFVLPACAWVIDLMRDRMSSWILPLVLISSAYAAQALHARGSIIPYIPLFAVGMLAHECQRRERIAKLLKRPAVAIAAVGALGLGMTFSATPNGSTIVLFGFFFTCVACGNSIGGVLRTRGALVLGECSYGIYLLHGIVLSVLFKEGATLIETIQTEKLPIALPLVAITLVLITPVTYLIIERPAMRVGSRLAKRWTSRRRAVYAPEIEVAP